jgi:penicillin-binding protein 1A
MTDYHNPQDPNSRRAAYFEDDEDENPRPWWSKLLLWLALGLGVLITAAVLFGGIALAVAYPKLPDISDLQDYRPKLPLRIYSVEGSLLGEFGEERRQLTPIKDIPPVMINAVLAIEDARFFSHGGVDYRGMLRAAIANMGRLRSQGASTITMQVARNVYLSSERTFSRKIYEVLLTFKLERSLSKNQILEIYMNQIYLGHRAYGFASAAEAYFGKSLKELTIAEAAMLAGLPKAPSAYNPISNPKRARIRQLHIIDRMLENGFITDIQAAAAKKQELQVRGSNDNSRIHAEYLAETVRQLIFSQYGDATYTRGLNVYTTIKAENQRAAYKALRRGLLDYERRQVYRGPEKFIDLPQNKTEAQDAIDDVLQDHSDNGDLIAAVVTEATPKKIVAERANGEIIEVTGEGLKPAQSGLSDRASPSIRIRRGAVIRVVKTTKGDWEMSQVPEVEGALVAMDPRNGSLLALVGGFDFEKNKFNHVTQAWRQPGSSFKPFVYSAALEKGFTPATVVNDAPIFFDAAATGGQAWEPKNYDGTFDGPMSLRRALAKSKNMVSIRVLKSIGPKYAQDWISQFGFDPEKHPPYLTLALGAGSVTPMQMVSGYSSFANGGYRVSPFLITKITEQSGKVLLEAKTPELDESKRAIDARNAFVMGSLLQEITRSGTAARAQATLKRPDLYGKTGTTNDSLDAWFVGYQPTIAAAVWIGYDNPRKLGDKETGGGLSLPVWISFMETALKGVPVQEPSAPEGVVNVGGEWYFEEFAKGNSVTSIGLEDGVDGKGNNQPAALSGGAPSIVVGTGGNNAAATGSTQPAPVNNTQGSLPNSEERRRILDMFKQ